MFKKRVAVKVFLSVIAFLVITFSVYAEDCSSKGSIQYKANGCNTDSRVCCASGSWSAWGSQCSGADNCLPEECWTGSTCAIDPPAPCSCDNGTCKRTWTCTPGTGWSYTDGTCVCNEGYILKNGKCEKKSSCIEGRSQSYSKKSCAECWAAAKGMTMAVPKCTSDSSIQCYIMQNPSGYESVSPDCTTTEKTTGSAGGSTSILTMRYNYGVGGTNCYFEGLQYRTCSD